MTLAPLLAAGTETTYGALIAIGSGVIVLGGIGAWIWSLSSKAAAMKFEMTPEGLRVDAPLYGKVIPRSALKLDEAAVVNLNERTELKPGLRTNGIGMPSARIGWFRLKNGHKGLVYLYKTDTAVCVPTTEGYTLLLGSANTPADGILRMLRS